MISGSVAVEVVVVAEDEVKDVSLVVVVVASALVVVSVLVVDSVLVELSASVSRC